MGGQTRASAALRAALFVRRMARGGRRRVGRQANKRGAVGGIHQWTSRLTLLVRGGPVRAAVRGGAQA